VIDPDVPVTVTITGDAEVGCVAEVLLPPPHPAANSESVATKKTSPNAFIARMRLRPPNFFRPARTGAKRARPGKSNAAW
jgi:hypothetical protein